MWTRRSTAFLERGCTPPFSFYHDLIPTYWTPSRPEGETGSLRWICTLARKMGVRSLVVEDACGRPEVSEELSALEDASPGVEGAASAAAITFLTRRHRRDAPPPTEAEVIGQAVVVSFPRAAGPHSYIFEANFRLPTRGRRPVPLLNNYLPLAREVEVLVRGERHRFRGIYFCEQNRVTSVCAHSALRTVVHALHGERIPTAEVQRLLGPMSEEGGISSTRLMGAIESFGHKARIYKFGATEDGRPASSVPDTPWGVLCSAVEAGHPALLIVKSEGEVDHVLPVLGYTLNTDEWHPHAADLYRRTSEPFLSSSHWVDHLIINDDLAGPHYCLAQTWVKNGGRTAAPAAVITVGPEEVDVTPAFAEPTAHSALLHLLPRLARVHQSRAKWWRFLVEGLVRGGHRPVLRTTLVSRADYLAHLSATASQMRRTLDPDISKQLTEALPTSFWLCEVSLPNLYVGNRAKLGEMMIRPSPRPRPGDSALTWVVGFRLPTVVGWRDGAEYRLRHCNLDRHARLIGDPSPQEW